MDNKGIEKIVSILANSNNTVVVTGAGISTEAAGLEMTWLQHRAFHFTIESLFFIMILGL